MNKSRIDNDNIDNDNIGDSLKHRRRILFISHSPHKNGAEICLLTLIRNINRKLFDPVVVFPSLGPLVEDMERIGVKTYVTPLERWIRYTFDDPVMDFDLNERTQNIVNIIGQESIDIVHTNTSVILEGAIASRIKNIPHVWHVHEFLKGHPDLTPCIPLTLVYWFISQLSRKIVCVSNFVRTQFEQIAEPEQLVTIHNGSEEQMISSLGKDIVPRNPNDDKPIIAVTLGLLSKGKGYATLLEAASILHNRNYNIKFLWLGGAEKQSVREFMVRVKELGLKNSVFYCGFRNDAASILQNSDFLICPSQLEALPMSILEAMSFGKPVVTTDCGGVSECVVDGETGYVVPVNEPTKMAERISDLIKDDEKRKVLGENALRHFEKNFTAKVFAEKFEQLYLEILHGKTRPKFTDRESLILDDLLFLYEDASAAHWRRLGKKIGKKRRTGFLW